MRAAHSQVDDPWPLPASAAALRCQADHYEVACLCRHGNQKPSKIIFKIVIMSQITPRHEIELHNESERDASSGIDLTPSNTGSEHTMFVGLSGHNHPLR